MTYIKAKRKTENKLLIAIIIIFILLMVLLLIYDFLYLDALVGNYKIGISRLCYAYDQRYHFGITMLGEKADIKSIKRYSITLPCDVSTLCIVNPDESLSFNVSNPYLKRYMGDKFRKNIILFREDGFHSAIHNESIYVMNASYSCHEGETVKHLIGMLDYKKVILTAKKISNNSYVSGQVSVFDEMKSYNLQ